MTEWKDGRPADWVNPMKNCEEENCRTCEHETGIYDAGASAMLSAVIKWLNEPCEKHPLKYWDKGKDIQFYYDRKRLCPECMKELESEK